MTMTTKPSIDRLSDLPVYTPPGHTGTYNVRLVDRDQCDRFEMVHGSIEPGGEAELHHHDVEYQAIFVLDGVAEVILGDSISETCHAGSIIRIPPGVPHYVKSVGKQALRMVIVYSPPLGRSKA